MMTKALKGTMAAAAGVALSLTGVAAAQAQEEEPTTLAASGTVVEEAKGIELNGTAVIIENEVEIEQPLTPRATLLGLNLGDGETRTVYCIQLQVDLEDDYPHEERPWEDIPVDDLPMVLGVLVNGFDGSNAAELLEAAGVAGETIDPFTQEQVAYAGTQSAIWSLTDRWTLGADATEGEDGVDKAVTAVQKYLLEESAPIEEPEEPYFEVDDSEAKTDGATSGPFTVDTNLDSLTFTQPEGATIVDENGDEVTSFEDGQSFYVKFAEEKTSTVTLVTDTVMWTTPAGRTFVPVDGDEEVTGQRLILAEEHTSEYAAEVEFEITVEAAPSESPKPNLPVTGSSLTTVASLGGAVLLAGVVAMVLMRRRAARADWGSDS